MENTDYKSHNLQMIESVSFRIKRNFDGVRLGPSGLSKLDRENILRDIKEVSKQFKYLDTNEFKFSGNLEENRDLII